MAGLITAIAGVAIAGASMGISMGQASSARRAAAKADESANRAMAEARKKLEKNYYEKLGINKEKYELETQALLVGGAQAVEASRESERGAVAGVGRTMMEQVKGQQGIRVAKGDEINRLDEMVAAEDSRLRDIDVQLDLGEVAGAQQAMADAEQQRAASTQQAMSSAGQVVSSAGSALGTMYAKSPEARQFNKGLRKALRTNKTDYMNNAVDAKKGFLGIGTGYNKALRGDVWGGKADGIKSNYIREQVLSQFGDNYNELNSLAVNTEGNTVGSVFSRNNIESMTDQDFDVWYRNLTPGQKSLVDEKLGIL